MQTGDQAERADLPATGILLAAFPGFRAGSDAARITHSRKSLLGAPEQLFGQFLHSRHLSVDYRGSDTRGSDPYGNRGQAAPKPYAAQVRHLAAMLCGGCTGMACPFG